MTEPRPHATPDQRTTRTTALTIAARVAGCSGRTPYQVIADAEIYADYLRNSNIVRYGEGGEGYVRLALTVPDERLREALDRIGAALAAS